MKKLPKYTLLGFGAASLMFSSALNAAEIRTWMSSKGTTLEAKLISYENGEVKLQKEDLSTLTLKAADLSLADKQHLVEYANADKKIIVEGRLAEPEKKSRIDKKTFKKLPDKFKLMDDSEGHFDAIETEHFIVGAVGRIRPDDVAEMAERLWNGMAFSHMGFREKWGDKKQVILLVKDETVYQQIGDWYRNKVLQSGDENAQARANSIGVTWPIVSSTGCTINEETMEKYNTFPIANIMRVKSKQTEGDFKKVFGPHPTHVIAKSILGRHAGNVSGISFEGYFAISTGFAYYKEIELAGKSNTQLIDTSGTGGDEISKASGFEDGRGWARALKKIVRKGDMKLRVSELLSYQVENLKPKQLVAIYSFSYYMQSTPERIANYAELIRRIESNSQVPKDIEIAKIFGFDSVAELEKDWEEFVKSTDFR